MKRRELNNYANNFGADKVATGTHLLLMIENLVQSTVLVGSICTVVNKSTLPASRSRFQPAEGRRGNPVKEHGVE